ncbi:MAG: hypothetical protein LDL44_00645 [Caenispirillum sp.]|nr:hypothetical protein [Caenispirillum sp.]
MARGYETFERDLKLSAGLFAEDMRLALADLAVTERNRMIRVDEASDVYDTFVNGRAGAPELSVRLPGPIVYEFGYLEEAVIYCLAFLEARSPKRSGRYSRSFFVLVDGQIWAEGSRIAPGAEVLVINDQPYSRKIHVGSEGFTTYKGLFEQARQATRRRLGGTVDTYVTFVQLRGGYVLKKAGTRARKNGSLYVRSDVSAGQAMKYPAVKIVRSDR